jgi:hypothetical protein
MEFDYPKIHQRISELQGAARSGDTTVTVEDYLKAVEELELSMAWRTNAEAAAYSLAVAIAPLCFHRRDLEDTLLRFLVSALMQYGYGDADGVIGWIEWNLQQVEPFGGLEADGIEWLRALTDRKAEIQRCINQLEEDDKKAAVEQILTDLSPHSAVARDRIRVRLECNNALLQESPCSVFFFDAGQRSETYRSFRVLTEVLEQFDPAGRIRLSFLFVPAWKRPERFRHPSHRNSWHYIGTEEPQTFWVRRGEVIGQVGAGVTDRRLFERFTAKLLR